MPHDGILQRGDSCWRRAALVLLAAVALPAAADGDLVIVNADVLPMNEERILERHNVVIRDGRIVEIVAADEPVPEDLPRLDGAGRYLMPGLGDLHTHVRNSGELSNYLAWGVTTILHLGGSGESGETLLRFRDEVRTGARRGPNVYTTNRVFDGDPALPRGALSLTDAEEARRQVRAVRNEGYDFVKIYNNVSRPVFAAIVDEADRQDLAVIGHIPRNFDSEDALSGGQDAVAHTEEFFFTYFDGPRSTENMARDFAIDESRIPELTGLLVENAVATMPDLSFSFTNLLMWDDLSLVWQDPEADYLHPSTLAMWRSSNLNRRPDLDRFILREQRKYGLMQKLTFAFQQAGVLQVIGTDASLPGLFPGKAAHRELTELVKAGLTNFEALAVGTRNAGEFIRRYIDPSMRTGQILEGYAADLVLLAANPLEDVRNARRIDAVIVAGRVSDRAALDRTRSALRDRYAMLGSLQSDVEEAIRSERLAEALRALIASHESDEEALGVIENRLNSAGYAAAFADDLDEAERLLTANTELFPDSANAWDSLAEVVLYRGDRERALALYRRALSVDPGFVNAADKIREIESDVSKER
ncbi:MAG: hypothetical protein R3315_04990 [Woeseiaceae bacterium]|nr:hypothetical protein [Woeseiaceae bacterium]